METKNNEKKHSFLVLVVNCKNLAPLRVLHFLKVSSPFDDDAVVQDVLLLIRRKRIMKNKTTLTCRHIPQQVQRTGQGYDFPKQKVPSCRDSFGSNQ